MSIHLAFAWLKERGFVEKYNPYHYPKGHPLAGKFAPKGVAGSATTVPYRGTRVHQKLVERGLAKPWEKKERPNKKTEASHVGTRERQQQLAARRDELEKQKSAAFQKLDKLTKEETAARKAEYGYLGNDNQEYNKLADAHKKAATATSDARKEYNQLYESHKQAVEKSLQGHEDTQNRRKLENRLEQVEKGKAEPITALGEARKHLQRMQEEGLSEAEKRKDPLYARIEKAADKANEGRYDKAFQAEIKGSKVTYDKAIQDSVGSDRQRVTEWHHHESESGFHLALHRQEKSKFGPRDQKLWDVSEVTSGRRIASGYSKENAISEAKKTIKELAPGELGKKVINGMTPALNKPPVEIEKKRKSKKVKEATEMTIHTAFNWLKDKGLTEKADKESKHIGFDGLVAKLMAKGYTKEQATKIAGKVYWQQQAKKKGKKQ